MPKRPCLTCGYRLATNGPRCPDCERQHQQHRNATRVHYHGDYDTRAAIVRINAAVCWLCGKGPRADDPWQADHVDPGDPLSELRPAHRSCNAARGNRR